MEHIFIYYIILFFTALVLCARMIKDDLDYTPVKLPQIVNKQIVELMKKLNLTFGGIDLALVDDTYYFIEINPTGEWGWLASSVKIPIDKAIVNCLAGVNAYGQDF